MILDASLPFASTGPQGHRGRMRAKLLGRGPDALADYELLEMLLFFALPRGDTKPLAKALLNRFATLAGVLGAEAGALRDAGLADNAVALVQLVNTAMQRLTEAEEEQRPHLASIDAAAHHLRSLGHVAGAVCLHLNSRNRLLGAQHLPATPAAAAQAIGAYALRHHASAALLAIIRPGRPAALPADRALVRRCAKACAALSITFHDGFVMSADGALSLRQAGLLA